MDFKKIIEQEELSGFPIGLGGCRNSNENFDTCAYDIVVFDDKSIPEKIVDVDGNFVVIHHGSFSENKSKKLLDYDSLKIIDDESWELRMFLSKIKEKRNSLFSDLGKNSLIESLFCCQKTKEAIDNDDSFASCWQKSASYFLADAISSLNNVRPNSTHMLDSLRKLEKNSVNEHVSVATQTIGIERATPTLLERMLKSTIGFSDMIEKNNHSLLIQQKHDFFVKNSMLADCYFYLGYVNRNNFVKIKERLNREQDMIHVLKIAFDVEADSNLLLQQSDQVQKSCNDILEIISST